jgi:hypothetical protein
VKKSSPIGVWFSVALVILIASFWAGTQLGKRAAVYWVRHKREQQEEAYGPDRVHLDRELDELSAVDFLRIFVVDDYGVKTFGEKPILGAVNDLQRVAQHPNPPDLKPLLDLELGLADLRAASVEEQNNKKDLAESYMKSAQSIFQSLGWQDTSEESLKNVMRIEFDRFDVPPAVEQLGK